MLKKFVLLFSVLLSISLSGQINSVTYDFESLTAGSVIAGQDNWQYMGNLNTSLNIPGSASCNIPSGPAPTDIVNTVTSGLYVGGKALRNPGNTGSSHGFATRKNNLGWGFTIPVNSEYLVLEFDYDNGNYWGEYVNLGYDKNGDGDYSSNCNAADLNELGLGIRLSAGNIALYKADGTTTVVTRVGSGWTRYGLTIDLRANGGQGAGFVCYKVLGTSGPWQQVTGLQNILMNINSSSVNQNNLQNLDGVIIQQEAGGVGSVDNLTISTYINNVIAPVTLCSNTNLIVSTLNIPSTTGYNWLTPAGSTYTSSVATLTINNVPGTQNGTFTVTTNDCSALTWTVPITVLTTPTITLTPSLTICSGTSASLTATGATTYSWIPSASLSSSTASVVNANPTSNTTYTVIGTSNSCTNTAVTTISVNTTPTVTLTNSLTICSGTSASLTATGATTYSWIPSASLSSSTASVVSANPTSNTTYTVIGTSNSCTNTAVTTISVNTTPTITLTNSLTICSGTSASLTATGATSYSWIPSASLSSSTASVVSANPTSNTTYTVIGTSNSCTNTAVTTISISITPTISISVTQLTLCSGSTTTITAVGALNYSWFPSTFSVINSSNIIASPTITTTYTITGADGPLPNLCSTTKTIQIIVQPKILPTVSPNNGICSGNSTTIFAIGGNTYNWAPTIGVANPNDSITIVNPNSTTIYTVTVSKNGLCPVTNTIQITVYPLPIVFAGRDTVINLDENIVLNGTGNVDVGFLSPDNIPLICNLCPIVTVYPKKSTCYTLEGINSFGCRNTDEICIVVTKNCDVFIPNSFTPNGDIDNEYFMPKGYGFSQIDLVIFDKWGKVIFNENNTTLGWDGKYNGVICPQGIYIYQVTVRALSGKEIYKTGHLTILTAR